MKEQLEKRINTLKQEYKNGQEQMTALEQRKQELQATLLRINGAIQVLEEVLAEENGKAEG